MVASFSAFERALSQRPISLWLARKTLDNNNKIQESSALPEPSQNAQRAGATMLELFKAPAPVGVVETMARRLSPPATASLNGVIDGGKARCDVGGTHSPATSPTRLEVPRRATRPLAVSEMYVHALPARSRSPQLMKSADSRSFGRRGCIQWFNNGMASMVLALSLSILSLSIGTHSVARKRTQTIPGSF
jgi:hypothetical protein